MKKTKVIVKKKVQTPPVKPKKESSGKCRFKKGPAEVKPAPRPETRKDYGEAIRRVIKNVQEQNKFQVAEDLGTPFVYQFETNGLTQSLVSTFRKCERKFRLTTMGLAPMKESQALIYGNVFHEALDIAQTLVKNGFVTTHDGFDFDDILAQLEEKFQDDYEKATSDGREYYELSFGWAYVTLPLYFEFWKNDFFGETKKNFVEVEDEFDVEFCGTRWRGKRDGVVEEFKKLWLWENKTKGQWNESVLIQIVERDLQNNGYLLAMELDPKYADRLDDIQGVIYNIIRRPQLRKKKTENMKQFIERCREDIAKRPEHYFVRLEVEISKAQRAMFRKQLTRQIGLVKNWCEEVQPKSHTLDIENTTECSGVYGECPFLNLCSSGMEDYTGLYIKEKLFSELEEANNGCHKA